MWKCIGFDDDDWLFRKGEEELAIPRTALQHIVVGGWYEINLQSGWVRCVDVPA